MLKRDDHEHPIPDELRVMFRNIVDAFVDGDFLLNRHAVEGVTRPDPSAARDFARNIEAYGGALAPLHDDVWLRAVYLWNGYGWSFLVDLTTEQERVSDLVLHANLSEAERVLELHSIHVP